MAKTSKKSKNAVPGEADRAALGSAAEEGAAPEPAQTTGAPKAAKTARKRRAATARKTGAAAKTRKTVSRKKPTPAEVSVSDDEIRLRAYFIAENRAQSGLPGDSASDWLEARRQLLEEVAAPRS